MCLKGTCSVIFSYNYTVTGSNENIVEAVSPGVAGNKTK